MNVKSSKHFSDRKPNMAMENHTMNEDVFPIENGDFPKTRLRVRLVVFAVIFLLCHFCRSFFSSVAEKTTSGLKRRELTEVEEKAQTYQMMADQHQQKVLELEARISSYEVLASQKDQENERLRLEVEANENKKIETVTRFILLIIGFSFLACFV